MKKSPLLERQKKNQVNKKAIYWVSGVLGAIIITISVFVIIGK